MEKTGDFEYRISKKDGKVTLRLPGGQIIPYDNRFPDSPPLKEGESLIIEKGD